MRRRDPGVGTLNRKSIKRYTLVLSGPQVRALHVIAHYGMNAIRSIGQEPYHIGNAASVQAAKRALRELDAVQGKAHDDERKP